SKKQGDYLTALAIMRPRVLDYDVHSCSSYSSSFLPGNIKINNPQDQSSRWSSGSNNQMQYVMIQLKTMAIAHTITFGKYHKVHVCNLKEFKVFGGLTTSNMTELLHTGLRNDSEPETFLLKHKTNSVVFPCQYIKIVPLVAWGANFNFSVWHVEVKGIPDPELVQETYFQYINFRETKSVRLCLKHFRQRKLLDAFKALQDRTNIELEHPLLTMLHHELVVRGNFKRAEELMIEAAERGLFDDYIRSYDYKPMWKRLQSNSHRQGFHHHHHSHQAHDEEGPRQRGGHQMCIDTQGGYVYLMGGWDGARELADFWAYHIPSQVWILISADTSLQGGPSARSCHKVCYSPQHRAIFLLGKYVDPDNRSKVDLSSDFWRFDINSASPPHGRWTKISGNTAGYGDFFAQMVNLRQNRMALQYCVHVLDTLCCTTMTRSLVIFAGQMNKDYLSDFYVYDIAADRVIEVCKDYNKQGGPEAGFTQRATISSRGREIYVLSGLVKDRALGAETVKNSFWVFKLPGLDQMHAIRDVQWALANIKASGSIGSLKSIMNHGRSLSEKMEPGDRDGDTSHSSTSRRRVDDEGNQRRQETRSCLTRSSGRSNDTSSESLLSTDAASNGEPIAVRTVQTRSTNNGRKVSLRSGSLLQSDAANASSTYSAIFGNDPSGASQTSNQGSSNTMKEVISAVSPVISARSLSSMEDGTSLGACQSSASQHTPTIVAERMSLAYVLSDQGSWQKIFQNSSLELGEPRELEPVPRYAHQLVYDDVNEVQYLFGGNPGEQGNMTKRLDDFWELRLYRPKPEEIVRRAKYLLRTQQFKELCRRPEASAMTSTTVPSLMTNGLGPSDSIKCASRASRTRSNGIQHAHKNGHASGMGVRISMVQRGTPEHHDQSVRALKFLQTELSCVVDQSNKTESDDFKALIRGLLLGAFSPSMGVASTLPNAPPQTPSFSFTGARARPAGTGTASSQKSTVLLTSSLIASPSLNSNRLMFSSRTSSAHASGTTPFLAPPDSNYMDMPIFDTNGHAPDFNGEVEGSPMKDSSTEEEEESRTSRRCGAARQIHDMGDLDNNGDKIRQVNQNVTQGEGKGVEEMNRDSDGDSKAYVDEVVIDEDEDSDMDDEEHDAMMRPFFRDRTLLYEKLLDFFSDEMKQPKGDLVDLVKVG
ncbi:Muskelin 1, intracellular mediator containing kelch motif, partial [Gamsiella multidivaricata]